MYTNKRKLKILFVACVLNGSNQTLSQTVHLKQDFEREYLSPLKITADNKVFEIETLSPREKRPVVIQSFRNDSPYSQYNVKACCPDSLDAGHGLFSELTLYEKGVSGMRDIMVLKLDSVTRKKENVRVVMSVKFHPFDNYRTDSLQILFLKHEQDVFSWLAGKDTNNQNISLCLKDVDNSRWTELGINLDITDSFGFVVVGNLKADDESKFIKNNRCLCAKREKAFWDYSSIFIDDIVIKENSCHF